jgi:hypothetical protein
VPSSRVKALMLRRVLAAAKTSGVTISSSSRANSASVRLDAVQGLEPLAEVLFQCGAVADVCAIFVLQVLKLANEAVFDAPEFTVGATQRSFMRQ